MKLIAIGLIWLAAPLVPQTVAQETVLRRQAQAHFRALTNGLTACGLELGAEDENHIQILSRISEPLKIFAGNHSFSLRIDLSAFRPYTWVSNLKSQDRLLTANPPTDAFYQFKLSREQAEIKAKAFASHLGQKVDHTYRFSAVEWPLSKKTNAYPATRSWRFSWHRHLGDYPIFSEMVHVAIDDESGGFAGYQSFARNEPYALIKHPVPTPEEARKRIEDVIRKGYELDPARPEKGYLHYIGGPFLVVASPRVLTAEQVAKLGRTPKGEQRVRLAWAYHFWIARNGKPSEERIKRLQSGEAARGLFDAETFEILPL